MVPGECSLVSLDLWRSQSAQGSVGVADDFVIRVGLPFYVALFDVICVRIFALAWSGSKTFAIYVGTGW